MPTSEYTPTVADIGNLLRARTVDASGNEVGTFNADTEPTGDNVTALIADAVGEAYPVFGSDIPDAAGSEPDALRNAAKKAVAYRAAALTELTYFAEEVQRGTSPYEQYQSAWEENLNRVAKAIESGGGDTPGGVGGSMAVYDGFPVDEGGLVGWGTRW